MKCVRCGARCDSSNLALSPARLNPAVQALLLTLALLAAATAQQQFQTDFKDYDFSLAPRRTVGPGGAAAPRAERRQEAEVETSTPVAILKQINE